MDLEEVITATVEKRVHDIVTRFIEGRHDYQDGTKSSTGIEDHVRRKIDQIAEQEVAKHEDAIREAIKAALANQPCGFEIKAYTTITFPEKDKRGDR